MNRTFVLYPVDDLPADLQASMRSRCGQKYRPSNGTEGEIFIENWCSQCARDRAMREGANIDECDDDEVCEIIARTFAHDVEDEQYPTEWQFDEHGQPCCKAFIPAGSVTPEPRCERTWEMF